MTNIKVIWCKFCPLVYRNDRGEYHCQHDIPGTIDNSISENERAKRPPHNCPLRKEDVRIFISLEV